MKIAIIYDSNTGNTEMLASAIREVLDDQDIVYFGRPEIDLPKADLYFIGSWTDRGDASKKVIEVLNGLHSKKIAYFATAGFKGEDYYERLFKRVGTHIPEDNVLLGHFYCQGKMPQATRERYEAMIKANPDDKDLKISLANFDAALSHPNEDDLTQVKDWALRIIDKI